MCGRYLTDDEAYAEVWTMMNTPGAGVESLIGSGPAQAAVGSGPAPAAVTNTTMNAFSAVPDTVTVTEVPTVIGTSAVTIGEVFPTNIAFVFTRDGAVAVKWGFPHWKNPGVIINARSETALEKAMFKKPLLKSRCVIPSCGFFEWSRVGSGKKKDKYLLRRPGEHILYMAGMVNTFRDTSGADYSAFIILTTSANDSVLPIHDRMPVILTPDERTHWLYDDQFMEHALHRTGPELSPAPVV